MKRLLWLLPAALFFILPFIVPPSTVMAARSVSAKCNPGHSCPTPTPTPTLTPMPTPTLTPTPTPSLGASFDHTLRYLNQCGVFNGCTWGQYGGTDFDTGASASSLAALPTGAHALVWVGDYDNSTCSWQVSDVSLVSQVQAIANDSRIAGWYISDEPNEVLCPTGPAQHAARTALIHQYDAHSTLAVIQAWRAETSTEFPYAPWKGSVDVLSFDIYPCHLSDSCDYNYIDRGVAAADALGVPWVAMVQSFGDAYYRVPTADELHQMMNHWRLGRNAKGYQTFAWEWTGGTGNWHLADHPDLLQQWAIENAQPFPNL